MSRNHERFPIDFMFQLTQSEFEIAVNIQIMRIFMLTDNTELRLDIEKIKKKLDNQDKNMEIVFRYLDVPIAIGIKKRKNHAKTWQNHAQKLDIKCLQKNKFNYIYINEIK